MTIGSELPALCALAEYCGVESEFEDARGETRTASPDTVRAILAAMGFEASSEERASATLNELTSKEWERALPPVIVCAGSAPPWQVEIIVPAQIEQLDWSIQMEGGGLISGSVKREQLRLVARGEAGGTPLEKRVLLLPTDLPLGYHRFSLGSAASESSLIVSPGECWLPAAAAGGERYWGLAAQLYTVRSSSNWGMGDYSDLGEIFRLTATAGGHVVGVNPLHALFPSNPAHASPYSPSSRLLLNVLYIDVTRVPEFASSSGAQRIVNSPAFQEQIGRCRAAHWVDYPTVGTCKLAVLHELFRHFATSAEPDRRAAFEAFRRQQSESFELANVFQALLEHLTATDPTLRDVTRWPEEFAHAEAAGIAKFRDQHAERITELMWLQWIADQQLSAATSLGAEMSIGLYGDLAVGADSCGAERWIKPSNFARAGVGAPPDLFNPEGQNWGLPPPHPLRWREEGFASYIELLRANMRHAGALRIDHAMGLLHQYWVPQGASSAAGAYVKYPFEELLAILALESHRNECLVVGEDLGTVPRGFRERMQRANVLSYRVLFFERESGDGEFLAEKAYPALSLACAGNHDLPTLRGWWTAESVSRADKERLCRRIGLRTVPWPDTDAVALAAHEFLARTPSLMTLVQLDDLTREEQPVNKPSATDYPNWQRRLALDLQELASDSVFRSTTEAMARGGRAHSLR